MTHVQAKKRKTNVTQRVLKVPFYSLSSGQQLSRRVTQAKNDWPTVNPGRSVAVNTIRRRGLDYIHGFNVHCLNCLHKKTYTCEHFGGENNAEALAHAHAADHECNPRNWKACD